MVPLARPRRRVATLAAGVVLAASLVPTGAGAGDTLGTVLFGVAVDLWLHGLAFAALAALLAWTGCEAPARRLPWTAGAVAAAALFGGAIELLQAPLPWRSASPADFLADVAGAVAGGAALAARRWIRRRG